ncbi:MAG: hypothetical protein NT062_10310, partial [Proteobacteria bacterium]|nr:hypothetical protein [Pseudomonadota bacterium]
MKVETWVVLAWLATACSAKEEPKAKTSPPAGCAPRLAALATFFDAVASEQQASPPHHGVSGAAAEAGVTSLVTIPGRPADVSTSDYLLVGPTRTILVTVDGAPHEIGEVGELDVELGHSKADALVIAIAPETPWRVVDRVRLALAPYGVPVHKTIALAYHADDDSKLILDEVRQAGFD